MGGVRFVLLRELQIPQELGVHSLHLDPGLGRGLPGEEPETKS